MSEHNNNNWTDYTTTGRKEPLNISIPDFHNLRSQWVHVAIIQDNSIIKMYMNGELYKHHTGHISEPLSECSFEIGRNPVTNNSNTILR